MVVSVLVISKNSFIKFGIMEILKGFFKKEASTTESHSFMYCKAKTVCDYNTESDMLFIDLSNTHPQEVLTYINNAKNSTHIFLLEDRKFSQYFFSINNLQFEHVTKLSPDVDLLLVKKIIHSQLKSFLSGVYSEGNTLTRKKEDISKLYNYKNNLTKNENIVINHFIRGLDGRTIAVRLNKSEKTVSGQKKSALKKLNFNSIAELASKVTVFN